MPEPNHTLTIFRVRPEVTDHDEILLERDALEPYDVRLRRRLIGILYVQEPVQKPARWLGYFNGAAQLDTDRLQGASVSAVLLLTRPSGTYALTFGYGRWLLNEEALEPTFGLRTTLNAIEPTKIRSMDHRRLDAVARHTREQVSKASGLLSFGVDVQRDLLRAVTGTPNDDTFGKQLSGAMPLVATGPFPLRRLEETIDRYYDLSCQTTYRANFPWVDNISEVTDRLQRTRLDEELIQQLRSGVYEGVWLAVPDIVNWGSIAGFQYRRGEDEPKHVETELADYFAEVRDPLGITKEQLRADRIFVEQTDDGAGAMSWQVYKCLIAELFIGAESFVLSEGKWYKVSQDYRTTVEQRVSTIRATTLRLPQYGDQTEAAYNGRVAEASSGSIHLLDRNLIRCSNGARIEACDLYSRDRKLVHVKHYGASSVLSHLFMQGVAASQMLAQDRAFRLAFDQKLPISHKLADPANPLRPQDYEVAYVIIRGGSRRNLPFLSQVTLHNSANLLEQLGFAVTLSYVPVMNASIR